MKIYYSPRTGAFYQTEIHKSMPQDVVEVAEAQWVQAIDLRGKGHQLIFKNGAFSAGEKTIASVVVASSPVLRQQLIAATDPLAVRHMRQELRFTAAEMEALAKKGKALTLAQFRELEAYTQALRDLPTTLKTWPTVADSDWPKKPAFMDKPSTQGV